ncbi:DUF2851 family protein [Polaribacter sp.]|uniref:DUF2851 family protein n=1 Tax=Polaribacter sp. TaxID=1920175 RepID=UPI003EF7D869
MSIKFYAIIKIDICIDLFFVTLRQKLAMKEDFLHYVWKYKLFSLNDLQTTTHTKITILKSGLHNKNAGPDFLNAQLLLDEQLWAGNVEIHLKSSDWYAHNHETDVNYDAVILHVVWEDDVPVFMKNNAPLPTLVLKGLVQRILLTKYQELFSTQSRWIPCEENINSVHNFILENWKERLFFERLERKSSEIKGFLVAENNNYEAVLFQLLAKNFGLKVNGDSFLRLATSMPFSVLQKVCLNKHQLAALLFGQAGFLADSIDVDYHQKLKVEYQFLQQKYKLTPISKHVFSFFRMRPHNFPTIRIAQLIILYHQHQKLFSKCLEIKDVKDFYKLFSVEVALFWKTHYTFEKSSKQSSKKLTTSFVDLLLINTIIPLQFLYKKEQGTINENEFLGLMKKLKPEKNGIISKFDTLHIKANNAFETQSLLELKNNYCAAKKCLECAIGVNVLKRK